MRAQGGDDSIFDRTPIYPVARDVVAERTGYLDLDAEKIGLCAVEAGAGRARKEDAIDPLASIFLHKKSGDRVEKGERVATVHSERMVTLPIAVALFRATGPAMNVAVAFYVAHWLGLQPTIGQMVAATAVGAVMSYGAVSLPGEVSYISSIAPIALALGVPIAPLGLLVAVEMVPDIFRTVGNVMHDVALAAIVDRSVGERA